MSRAELRGQLEQYYKESDVKYLNWGRDEEREGIYALHCGFHIKGKDQTHYEEIKEHTRQILKYASVEPGNLVLDAGCGTGSIGFEAMSLGAKAIGVNILEAQLQRAQKYNKSYPSGEGASFLVQDYQHLGFRGNIFDRVIFAESYIHSDNKQMLLEEAFRVLKPGGVIVIADVFLENDPHGSKEERMLEDVMDGWYMPTIPSLTELLEMFKGVGFKELGSLDVTENILPSTERMRLNAEKRLLESNMTTDAVHKSRLAVVGGNELMRTGVTKYFYVRGTK